ncbi:MAG: hypothetical protein A3H33_01890 [Betaproteobacteria bacterium RIFCSPLOWO2_02_FULL_65_20]|nr:MAG: hypothetical protein A3H33_01890 [Betaproteobacteria bacterium RIFCSPLOWO2_02_FULL_65_20]
MTTQAGKFPPVLLWTAAIALILFCAAGIAAFMGWIPNSSGNTGDGVMSGQNPANTPSAGARRAETAKPRTAPVQVARKDAEKTKCAECGVIESTRQIESRAEGTGLGAVGGAVVGGLLGNQVGGGRGKDVMTVVGAVGGGLAGNEIEKRVKSTTSYAITVRFEDGSTRVFNEANAPTWRNGDKVKVVNGVIHSNA